MARVSVIMPAYNGSEYIAESIETILGQSYADWELVICDDCSTDGTYEIARSYAAAHPNIKVLRNETNVGAGAARNRCIRQAEGEYLLLMDCDDLSYPQRMEKQVAFLDTHPEYSFVGTSGLMFDERGIWRSFNYPRAPQKEAVAFGGQFLLGSICFRARDLLSVGGYEEDRRYLLGEDHNLCVRLYAAGFAGYNLQDCLYGYRIGRNSNYNMTFKKRILLWKIYRESAQMLKLPRHYRIRPYKQLLLALIPRRLLSLLRRD